MTGQMDFTRREALALGLAGGLLAAAPARAEVTAVGTVLCRKDDHLCLDRRS
jgi:hypothetical protein